MKQEKKYKRRRLAAAAVLGVLLLLVVSCCFALGYHGFGPAEKTVPAPQKTQQKQDAAPAEKKASPLQDLQNKDKQPEPEKKENLDAPLAAGTKYTVLVDKSEHKLYLKDGDTIVRAWDCAVGKGGLGQKQRRGDNMTPLGTFKVDEIDDASSWTHDFGDGRGQISGAYGPWFISLDTYGLSRGNWDGIGIHGTHDPASLGTDASEGCVRLLNDNLRELKKVAYVGMPVTIQD